MAMEPEHSSGEDSFCTFAGKNPTCPYVSQIKQQGEDMQSGLVKKVNSMQSSWRALQPYLLIIVTAFATWALTHLHW